MHMQTAHVSLPLTPSSGTADPIKLPTSCRLQSLANSSSCLQDCGWIDGLGACFRNTVWCARSQGVPLSIIHGSLFKSFVLSVPFNHHISVITPSS